MPDQLYLSLRLRSFDPESMLRHFEQLLRVFPFSQLRPGISAVRIYAIEYTEPPLFEQAMAAETDVDTVIGICQEFNNPDCAYTVDGLWELFHYREDGWKLAPSRVSFSCFGPEFDNEERDDLRIELGPDSDYLPNPEFPDGARKSQSNLRSLLRLVHDIEENLPVEDKRLWTESGDNFADRVEGALSEEL